MLFLRRANTAKNLNKTCLFCVLLRQLRSSAVLTYVFVRSALRPLASLHNTKNPASQMSIPASWMKNPAYWMNTPASRMNE